MKFYAALNSPGVAPHRPNVQTIRRFSSTNHRPWCLTPEPPEHARAVYFALEPAEISNGTCSVGGKILNLWMCHERPAHPLGIDVQSFSAAAPLHGSVPSHSVFETLLGSVNTLSPYFFLRALGPGMIYLGAQEHHRETSGSFQTSKAVWEK